MGILRETSREAFKNSPRVFSTLREAFQDIQSRLNLHADNFINKSYLLKNYGQQKKLSQFF